MRFYDKKGRQHSNRFAAYWSDIKDSTKMFFGRTVKCDPIKEQKPEPIDDPQLEETPEDPAFEGPIEEEPAPITYTKIVIDYTHGWLNLLDDDGTIVMRTMLDQRLMNLTTDKLLMEVLYDGEEIPEEIKTNIETIGREVESFEQPSTVDPPIPSYDSPQDEYPHAMG